VIKIFLPLTANTTVKMQENFSNHLGVGNELVFMLPHDDKEKKEALLWLATQLEQEARKL